MKITVLLSLFFLLCNVGLAQSPEWTLYKSIDNIDIFTTKDIVKDPTRSSSKEYVFFRFVNTSSEDKTIELKKEYYYNNLCANCNQNSDEHKFIVKLSGNESTTSNLKDINADYKVFSKFIGLEGKRELSKVELIKTNK